MTPEKGSNLSIAMGATHGKDDREKMDFPTPKGVELDSPLVLKFQELPNWTVLPNPCMFKSKTGY